MSSLNIVGVNGNIGSGKDTVADRFVQQGYCKISLADPMKRLAYKVFAFTEDQLWGPSDRRNAEDPRFYVNSLEWRTAERNIHAESLTWLRDLFPNTEEKALYMRQDALLNWFYKLELHHPKLSPRVCLQLLGTEWGREQCDKDVWVNYMARTSGVLLGYDTSDKLHGHVYAYDRLHGLHLAKDAARSKGVVVPDIRFENELLFCAGNNYPVIKVVRPETDHLATGVGVAKHKSETEQEGFDPTLFSIIIQNDKSLEDLLSKADFLAAGYASPGYTNK